MFINGSEYLKLFVNGDSGICASLRKRIKNEAVKNMGNCMFGKGLTDE